MSALNSIVTTFRIRERLVAAVTAAPDSRAYLDQVARIDAIFIDEIRRIVYDSVESDSSEIVQSDS